MNKVRQDVPSKVSKPPPIPDDRSLLKESDGGIEQVRELLFGARMKEQEKHFQSLQSKIESALQTARSDFEKRLESLEGFIKSEMKALADRVKTEHDGWENASDKAGMATSELRALLLNETKGIRDEVKAAQKKQSDEFLNDLHLLDETKVNRLQFIELLNDWSVKLGYEGDTKHS
jgi:hypothetical protein